MSGAFGVRGGFDSHAFPPAFLLAAALLLLPLAAAADPPPGAPVGPPAPPAPPLDSLATPAAPDTAAVKIVEVGRVSRATRPDTTKTPRFSEPRYVMLRSLLVPGWGQLYNRSWFKALLAAGIEGSLIAGLINDERQLDRLARRVDEAQGSIDETEFNAAVEAYNNRLEQSIGRRWLLGGALAYALVDAYVDAHFRNFEVEFGPDPALPEGVTPPTKGKTGGRMSLRWSF